LIQSIPKLSDFEFYTFSSHGDEARQDFLAKIVVPKEHWLELVRPPGSGAPGLLASVFQLFAMSAIAHLMHLMHLYKELPLEAILAFELNASRVHKIIHI
jgi:hypothetical protein